MHSAHIHTYTHMNEYKSIFKKVSSFSCQPDVVQRTLSSSARSGLLPGQPLAAHSTDEKSRNRPIPSGKCLRQTLNLQSHDFEKLPASNVSKEKYPTEGSFWKIFQTVLNIVPSHPQLRNETVRLTVILGMNWVVPLDCAGSPVSGY